MYENDKYHCCLEDCEESVFKLFSLIVVYPGWGAKSHYEIIKQLPGCGFPRLVLCLHMLEHT